MAANIREPGFGSTTVAPKKKGQIIAGCIHGLTTTGDACSAGLTCTRLGGITLECPALDPEVNCLEVDGKYAIRETVLPKEHDVAPTLWGPFNE